MSWSSCRVGALLLGVACCLGCSAEDTRPSPRAAAVSATIQETAHPAREYLTPEADVTIARNAEEGNTGVPPLSEFRARLDSRTRVGAVATADGVGDIAWGRLRDVVVAPSGDLLVLNSDLGDVRRFSAEGEFLGYLMDSDGKRRNFADPVQLVVTRSSGLIVAESRGELVTENPLFEYESGRFPEQDGRIEGACAIDDRIFVKVADSRQQQLIRFRDPNGSGRGAFGELPYKGTDNWLALIELSPGGVVCSAGERLVLVAFRSLPIVRAYDFDGEVRWTSLLADVQPVPVKELTRPDGRTGVRLAVSEGGDLPVAFELGPQGVAVFQVAKLDPKQEGERRRPRLLTYLLDVATGEGTFIGDSIPMIVAIGDSHLYTVEILDRNTDPAFLVYEF